MSKRKDPAREASGRRAGSGQYKVTDRRRVIREVGGGSRQVVARSGQQIGIRPGERSTHSRRETVRRAAKIVVRLHRDALKELEKY